MCLNTITKRFDTPDPKVRTGWKYVREGFNGNLYGIFKGRDAYSYEWQKADSHNTVRTINDYRSNREEYKVGFHVFPTREDARKAKRALAKNPYGVFANANNVKLVKVEVRDVTVEGIDATSTEDRYLNAKIRTLVANSMRIVKVVKD